jgi:hypothetical protein
MFFVLESEAVSLTGVFQCRCIINEKYSIIDIVSLAEFREKRAGNYVRTRRFKLCLE